MKRRSVTLIVTALMLINMSTAPSFAASNLSDTVSGFVSAYSELAADIDQAVFDMVSNVISKFIDVDEDFWGAQYIAAMFDKGVVSGYEDGSFRPNNGISIAEFTTMLVNQEEYELVSAGSTWYMPYVATAVKNGVITSGDFETGIDYTQGITRGEMARMIARAAGLDEVTGSSFEDNSELGVYRGYVYAVANASIISGFPDGTFRADDGATRAQACVMLVNLETCLTGSEDAPDSEEMTWETAYGTILEPTDYDMNEDIWSDSEFHRILTKDQSVLKNVLKIHLKDDHKEVDEPYPYYLWYYDPDLRAFFVNINGGHEDENGDYVYKYANMNEALGDDYMFDTMKAACYHALMNDLEIHLANFNYDRARLSLGNQEDGGTMFAINLNYKLGGVDFFYEQVDEYESGVTNIIHEWEFNSLYDIEDLFPLGYVEFSSEDLRPYMKQINYMDSQYTDAVYGICDYVFSDDGLDIYRALMADYLKESELSVQQELRTEEFYAEVIGDYWMMKSDFETTSPGYAIVKR